MTIPINSVYVGDVLDFASMLEPESIHTIITSPPYWGLRDYGHGGQLGLEDTPEQYVTNIVAVFEALKPALRADGTLWLNLGDSIRKKNFVGIPWRVAFVLQAAGWYLRSEIIWHKPNVMPESVRDRPTKAHEQIFLLTKSPRYYYDADAIREPHSRQWWNETITIEDTKIVMDRNDGGNMQGKGNPNGRNKRTVWTVATVPTAYAHFATFPPDLIRPCILAGTSPQVCELCGAPWKRVVTRELSDTEGWGKATKNHHEGINGDDAIARNKQGRAGNSVVHTIGWSPSCLCENEGTAKAIVCDPFMGSGTTAQVAVQEGRHYIGCDLDECSPGWIADRLAKINPQLTFDIAA